MMNPLFLSLVVLVFISCKNNSARVEHLQSKIQVTKRNLQHVELTLQGRSGMKGVSLHYENLAKEREQLQARLDSLLIIRSASEN